MKHILPLAAGLTALSLTTNAQLKQADISVSITSPANNVVIAPNDTLWLSFDFTNNGPDILPAGDSLFFGTANLVLFSQLSTDLPVGGTIMMNNMVYFTNPTNDTISGDICVAHVAQSAVTYENGTHPATTYEDANAANDTSCITVKLSPPTSIKNAVAHKNQFELFPNPVKDQLFITALEANKNIELTIFNALGQAVWQNTRNSGTDKQIKIDVAALPAGVFYLQQNLDGRKASARFVK